jgi:hypothetical protein
MTCKNFIAGGLFARKSRLQHFDEPNQFPAREFGQLFICPSFKQVVPLGRDRLSDLATMTVLGLIVGLVILVSIVLMAIVGGSHVFD